MSTDLLYCRSVLTRIKSHRSLRPGYGRKQRMLTLPPFASYTLGSDMNGKTTSCLPCGNFSGKGEPCPDPGVLCCSRCSLVKYCSGRCQRQHWPKHRIDCEHPYLNEDWQPSWVTENRNPNFFKSSTLPGQCIWGTITAYDILQLNHNEGLDAIKNDFKLCFTAVEDIRNLVKTVNGLPREYRGRCDVLLNGLDATSVNRIFVILYVLLASGPSLDESAELATHLMYSARLPEAGATHVRRCVQRIFGEGSVDGDMSFHRCLRTRGRGKLVSMQSATGIKRPMDMFMSTYELPEAMKSMHACLLDPAMEDDRQRLLATFQPSHRLALSRFWETGVLSPFSMNTKHFSEPNRLLFSSKGEWLGQHDANPLRGWDASAARCSGKKYDVEPSDILGCLFFHIKDELREFSSRIRDFNIDIYLTQYDPRILSKAIATGVLPAFEGSCFDRIDTSNMIDHGLKEQLLSWGSLLNKDNPHATILMHSTQWHIDQKKATARYNPKIFEVIKRRCQKMPELETRLQNVMSKGPQSLFLYKLVISMDAFVDHETAFNKYLIQQQAESTADGLRLRLRDWNRVHPKRLGVPLHAPQQKLPDLSREEFYNLFVIGGQDATVRFLEFESFLHGWEWAGADKDEVDAARNYKRFLVTGLVN